MPSYARHTMSLNNSEQHRTSAELTANLELSGLDLAEVQADLDFTPIRLQSTLAFDNAQPADVWLLRDYLDQVIIDRGRMPLPYTTLTEQARVNANRWFSLQVAPRHEAD